MVSIELKPSNLPRIFQNVTQSTSFADNATATVKLKSPLAWSN